MDWIGGSPGSGCGNLGADKSLYFNLYGRRMAITVDMDTTNTRIIEFIVRVGSSSSSGTCDYGDSTDEGVVAMFSTNGGISWTRLAIFSYYGYRSVTTYRSALPSAARSSSTRFGWWQPFNSGDNQDEWAIDDVFIGGEDINPTSMYETFDPISQGSWLFYNGGIVNGYCNSGRHALVFSGKSTSSRSATTRELRLKLSATTVFKWNGESISSSFLSMSGGALGRPCTTSGQANVLFFNGGNDLATINREVITRDLNTTLADYVSFYIVIGGISGGCDSVEDSDEGVRLSFSTDGGKNWILLYNLAYNSYGNYRSVQVNLPTTAKTPLTRFRWMQLRYSQKGSDTWALGDIAIRSFDPKPEYEVQFDLVFNCNGSDTAVNSYVSLQMATGISTTWTEVHSVCRPPGGSSGSGAICSASTGYMSSSRWYWHGNDRWRHVTVSLNSPSTLLTEYTRFRFTQGGRGYFPLTQPFAIDNVYIGLVCLNFCSGRGQCRNGQCVCDVGYSGSECTHAIGYYKQSLQDAFILPWQGEKKAQWLEVTGGGAAVSCTGSGDNVLLMNGGLDLRLLTTIDLDTRFLTDFSFGFILGGSGCDPAESGEDVYVSFSKNAGVTWNTLKILGYAGYRTRQTVTISLPSDARANLVRFQWIQYQNSGTNSDVWFVDDVLIGGSCLTNPCQNSGTCLEVGVGSHVCNCPPGFTGSQCEQKIDPCKAAPCKNGATCDSTGLGANGYTCTCTTGFTGAVCDISTSACDSLPCQNNGKCDDLVNYPANHYVTTSCIGRCGKFVRGMQCQCDTSCASFITGCCGDLTTFCGVNATSYVCTCPTGYEGLHCERKIDYCAVAPCLNGATCTSALTGAICQCAAGFTGSTCDVDINECLSSPCQNGGTCVDGRNGYKCSCVTGYNGDHCGTKINYCLVRPCSSGSTCVPLVGGYQCVCPRGHTGQNCSQIIDNCAATILPCANGGRCINSIGSYTCQCGSRFTGTHCQTEILPCSSFPCINQGTCVNEKDGNFTCQCVSEFSGNQCEILPPICSSSPCMNGATCASFTSKFFCYCPDGWTGNQCETEVIECQSSPCQHGGTCVDRVGYFECGCILGYSDPVCGTNVDDCRDNPCLNGGTCTDGINEFSCTCPHRFTGQVCNVTLDSCVSNPCFHGQCISQGSLGFNCKCEKGYFGLLCENETNECSQSIQAGSVPCHNGGACVDKVGLFECTCVPGFTGLRCETNIDDCSSNNCKNGATCVDKLNNYTCLCPAGITGLQCQFDIDECLSNPCLNEGLCTNHVARYDCSCKKSHTGTHCETRLPFCLSTPCLNGGVCSELETGGYNCSCQLGFEGVRCEMNQTDHCASSPCQNRGRCLSLFSTYRCLCPNLATGRNCETTVLSACSSSPCRNGGSCISQSSESFVCVCPAEFTGALCNVDVVDVDECKLLTCRNGGICRAGKCVCLSSFTGTLCEVRINPCESIPCGENEVCSLSTSLSGYSCTCREGFTGSPCYRPACESNPCHNGGKCIVQGADNGYRCQCKDEFKGAFCQLEATGEPGSPDNVSAGNDNSKDSIPSYVWIIVAVGVALMIVILLAVLVLYKRRGYGYEVDYSGTSVSQVDNPLYGESSSGKCDTISGKPISFDGPMQDPEGSTDGSNFASSSLEGGSPVS